MCPYCKIWMWFHPPLSGKYIFYFLGTFFVNRFKAVGILAYLFLQFLLIVFFDTLLNLHNKICLKILETNLEKIKKSKFNIIFRILWIIIAKFFAWRGPLKRIQKFWKWEYFSLSMGLFLKFHVNILKCFCIHF